MNKDDVIKITRTVNIYGDIYKESYVKNIYTSSDGEVAKVIFNDHGVESTRILPQETMHGGYKRVRRGATTHLSVHRLVYDCWSGEELDNNLVIDHIDANPSNNDISNLRQITQKENIQHAIEIGNFCKAHNKKITVFDSETNTSKDYDSVHDFLIDIGAPEYMIENGGSAGLRKRREYDRYTVIKAQ